MKSTLEESSRKQPSNSELQCESGNNRNEINSEQGDRDNMETEYVLDKSSEIPNQTKNVDESRSPRTEEQLVGKNSKQVEGKRENCTGNEEAQEKIQIFKETKNKDENIPGSKKGNTRRMKGRTWEVKWKAKKKRLQTGKNIIRKK